MKAAKKCHIKKSKKNGEISNMNLFIICFTSAALLYVLTLPFVGQRAKKAHTEEKIEEGTHETKTLSV